MKKYHYRDPIAVSVKLKPEASTLYDPSQGALIHTPGRSYVTEDYSSGNALHLTAAVTDDGG